MDVGKVCEQDAEALQAKRCAENAIAYHGLRANKLVINRTLDRRLLTHFRVKFRP